MKKNTNETDAHLTNFQIEDELILHPYNDRHIPPGVEAELAMMARNFTFSYDDFRAAWFATVDLLPANESNVNRLNYLRIAAHLSAARGLGGIRVSVQ